MTPLSPGTAVLVLGKGGVGRTTVSVALARGLARSGRRVALIELDGRTAAARQMGVQAGSYEGLTVDGVDVVRMTAREAFADFAGRRMGQRGARWLASGAAWSWLDALPSFADVIQLGRIEHVLREPDPGDPAWDVAVIDAPATGHAAAWMAGPAALAEGLGEGPVAALTGRLGSWLADVNAVRRVVVTLGEPVVCQETAELLASLKAVNVDLLVHNRAPTPSLRGVPEAALEAYGRWADDSRRERVFRLVDDDVQIDAAWRRVAGLGVTCVRRLPLGEPRALPWE